MVDIIHANAFVEVLEIIKNISKEDYNKIPKENIELFEIYSNNEYHFKYDPKKTLDEQNVSKTAKIIIGIMFRDYWATDYQRKQIMIRQRNNREKIEEKKKEKYNSDNIFNNN